MSEYDALKEKLEDLQAEVKANTVITQEGFSTMNGRVKKLEIAEARREGRESVLSTVPTSEMDWKKIAFGLITILTTAMGLAVYVARIVIK